MGWLEAVQARAESEDNIANLPAIRILDFFENLSQQMSKSDQARDQDARAESTETRNGGLENAETKNAQGEEIAAERKRNIRRRAQWSGPIRRKCM